MYIYIYVISLLPHPLLHILASSANLSIMLCEKFSKSLTSTSSKSTSKGGVAELPECASTPPPSSPLTVPARAYALVTMLMISFVLAIYSWTSPSSSPSEYTTLASSPLQSPHHCNVRRSSSNTIILSRFVNQDCLKYCRLCAGRIINEIRFRCSVDANGGATL